MIQVGWPNPILKEILEDLGGSPESVDPAAETLKKILENEGGSPKHRDSTARSLKKWLAAASGTSDYKDTVGTALDKLLVAYGGEAQPRKGRNAKIAALLDLLTNDPDAEAFFVRAGISNQTQKDAVNEFVMGLKADGLWEKFSALYPCVGGTATAHSKNLKADEFNITWIGGVTHNASGFTPNGTTGYGDSNLPRASLAVVQIHLSAYYINIVETGFHSAIGIDDFGGAGSQFTELFHAGGGAEFRNNSTASTAGFGISEGLFVGSRSLTHDQILAPGEVAFISNASAAPAANIAGDFFIGALNRIGSPTNFSADTFGLISAGGELTLAQAIAFRNRVQTYQTALGRAV